MGVERSVTCWHAQQQIILNEIALLESLLRGTEGAMNRAPTDGNEIADVRSAELVLQLVRAREKLSSLGPCPKPMMG
jgi:hypothetical protein